MSEVTHQGTLSDAELDALLASRATAVATMIHCPATDGVEQQLQTVAEILSQLATLPRAPSLAGRIDGGPVRVTPVGDNIVVGRSSKCDISCRMDSGLSKSHFELRRHEGDYFVRDLDSMNGTFSNGRPCAPGELRHLLDGDVITASEHQFVFLAGMIEQRTT